jgi:hypothetical protein
MGSYTMDWWNLGKSRSPYTYVGYCYDTNVARRMWPAELRNNDSQSTLDHQDGEKATVSSTKAIHKPCPFRRHPVLHRSVRTTYYWKAEGDQTKHDPTAIVTWLSA